MKTIVGLLLAAGCSRRFGSDKLLHPLPDGDLIVVASARRLAAATDHAIALIRPQQSALRASLKGLGVEVVEVANAESGMGVTLAAGIRAAAQAAGWVVALADMPRVYADTMRRVAIALRDGASIAAPFHGGRRGHPVGFARQWHDTLTALQGNEGARSLLQTHGECITRIDVNDPGCLMDIDTPADLNSFVFSNKCTEV